MSPAEANYAVLYKSAEDGVYIQDVNVYFAQGSLCSGTLMNPRYPHGHLTESRVLRLIVY